MCGGFYTFTSIFVIQQQWLMFTSYLFEDSCHAVEAEPHSLLFKKSKTIMCYCLRKGTLVKQPDQALEIISQQYPACVHVTDLPQQQLFFFSTDPEDAQVCIFSSVKWHPFIFALLEVDLNRFHLCRRE